MKPLWNYYNKSVFFTLIVLIYLLIVPTHIIHAASITVDATCSLSDAITAANTDTATGGCPAGSLHDTIIFTSNINRSDLPADFRIALFDPERSLAPGNSTLTIEGGGYTLDAQNSYLWLGVDGYHGNRSLTVNNLTMVNQANLHVSRDSSLTVNSSTFTGSYINANLQGRATINNSTFSGNSLTPALNMYGSSVTVTGSTFTRNTASAIVNNSGSLTVFQ